MTAKRDCKFHAVEKDGVGTKVVVYELQKGKPIKAPKVHIALMVACNLVEGAKKR